MTWVSIPDEAVQAGAPASPFLMRGLRDNDEAIANANLTVAAMLNGTTGHVHGNGTRSITYNFTDLVVVKAGFNDCIPFRYADPSHAVDEYCPTVAAGTYELDVLAGLIQAGMIAEVGAPTATITVVYDDLEGSPTRGLFIFRHTGVSGTRVLDLLFASGINASECIGPSVGFAKLDRMGAFAYAGDSGFSDGYLQDSHTTREGGLLGVDAWVPGAFTDDKLGDNVISTRCFVTDSVSGSAGSDKIQDRTLDGDKTGAPQQDSLFNMTATSTHDFSITYPAGRTPMVVPYTIDAGGALCDVLSVDLLSFSGGVWTVRVQNRDSGPHLVAVAAY